MNRPLLHIFDSSTCLTRKQVKEYVSRNMSNEEVHATEVHLLSCPLCSHAIEGMYARKEGLEPMMELDAEFLVPYFPLHDPQVHLNSIAPVEPVAVAYPAYGRKKDKLPVWKRPAMVGTLILMILALWFYQHATPDSVSLDKSSAATSQTDKQVNEANTNTTNLATVDATPQVMQEQPLPGNEPQQNNFDNDQSQKPQPLIITDKKEIEETEDHAAEKTAAEKTVVKNATDAAKETAKTTTTDNAATTVKKDAVPTAKPTKKAIVRPVENTDSNLESISISTAKGYIEQGDNNKAREMLKTIVDDSSGSQKRKARRILRNMGDE